MKLTFGLGLLCIPLTLFAAQSYYCPQNHAYVSVGMTTAQVTAACGQPISQQNSNEPVLQRIPVQQLIYNNAGAKNAYSGVWQVPGSSGAGSGSAYYNVWAIPAAGGGIQLEVNIVDQKVKSLKVNGSNSNAISVCGGGTVEPGDPVQRVFSSCGNPTLTNNTFINEVVRTAEKPKIWIYQPNQYEPTVSMTFVDGKLLSIQ